MKVKEVQFAFIPPGVVGSVFVCKCGGIQIYAASRSAAICFRCGRDMKCLAEVTACAPSPRLGRLSLVTAGGGE